MYVEYWVDPLEPDAVRETPTDKAMRVDMKRVISCLVVGLVGLLWATHAMAQAMKYVDRQGMPHYVQSADQIPPEYRSKVETPQLPNIDPSKGENQEAAARRRQFENEAIRQRDQKSATDEREQAQHEQERQPAAERAIGDERQRLQDAQERADIAKRRNWTDYCNRNYTLRVREKCMQYGRDYGMIPPDTQFPWDKRW
jgi:hypothetical protein